MLVIQRAWWYPSLYQAESAQAESPRVHFHHQAGAPIEQVIWYRQACRTAGGGGGGGGGRLVGSRIPSILPAGREAGMGGGRAQKSRKCR